MTAPNLASLARRINADHARAERAMTTWYQYARRAGERLIDVKRRAGHRHFMRWVEANCSFSYDTASLYMRVAANWDEANLERVQSLRQAKQLLQTRGREPSRDAPPLRRMADDYLTALRQVEIATDRALETPERLQAIAKVIRERHAGLRLKQERLERRLGDQAAA